MKYYHLHIRHLLHLLLLSSFPALAQYSGGDGDGTALGSLYGEVLNEQGPYCSGGENDGYDNVQYTGLAYNPSFVFEGGQADGFNKGASDAGTLNEQLPYCSSGSHDGFSYAVFSGYGYPDDVAFGGGYEDGFALVEQNTILNEQGHYCNGGDNDGFSFNTFGGYAYTPLAFAGGNDDGFSLSEHSSYVFENNLFGGGVGDGGDQAGLEGQYLGYDIWTGLSNRDWENISNWKYNTLPTSSSLVTIPPGCPNYPLLTGSLSIKNYYGVDYTIDRLDILQGGALNCEDQLVVGGELNVWGDLGIEGGINQLVKITNGGMLEVDSTGSLSVGLQTSGPALADLIILNNGILSLKNGTIEIDDQLNVLFGGRLEMHEGTLFAHKFGEGSPIGTLGNYSPFYINSGAQGFINGGTLNIAGKPSETAFAAIQINEPAFVFGDNSLITVKNGISADHQDCGIKTAQGVSLGNLQIDDDKRLIINSNLHVRTSLEVTTEAELKIETGNTLHVGN